MADLLFYDPDLAGAGAAASAGLSIIVEVAHNVLKSHDALPQAADFGKHW